ncbi:hypothetical protein DAPPUDRAFT_346882 [Daphnia pulex]|uniref:Gustatory receptor n=1 Tax=Daphnia pulex TaxID=6669 RepID=E9H0A7_DAPPU|nr:hypothetical protein DAPPUDRAFT_346882 [Daphnia pulex]|eukprot:EFX74771.1 hypothetical protein DAPPUDRAFT_346882 [Daphnia pulex]
MVAETLRDRFLRLALSPLSALLKIVGVFYNQNLDSQQTQRLCRSGTFFLLILAIQSNIYIFVRRSQIIEILFGSQEINVDKLIEVLVHELTRFSQLVSDAIVHLSLVFKIWPSVTLFLETLESVDSQFGQPSLSPIKRYSLFGLIYMLFMVVLNWILFTHFDLNHPVRLAYWLDMLQNSIKIFSNLCLTVLPVWLFIICGQLYIFYTRKLIANLKLLYLMVRNATVPSGTAVQRTFSNLRSLKHLYLAAELLHRHFSTVLAVNCFLTFVTMFTSSYYIIEFYKRGNVIVVCWSCIDVLEAFLRFWLICHTSDQIREITIECITVLRSLRDTRNEGNMSECNKITSYIIEISQMSKNLDRHSLNGVLSLSKSLIIPTLEIIFTYLLIIYQFKSAGEGTS